MVGTAQARLCPPYGSAYPSTCNCHMLRDIKTARNALSEVPPMPIRHRSALAAALWLLTAAVPAPADDIMLPREPQVGPRPFYLVDKMKDGPLKQQLSQCTGPFRKTDFSIGHRGAALEFPEHTKEVLCSGRPDGRRHHRMRRDLHQRPRTGLPALAVRPAHHDQHPDGAGACRKMHAGLQPRRPGNRQEGVGKMLYQRHHAC